MLYTYVQVNLFHLNAYTIHSYMYTHLNENSKVTVFYLRLTFSLILKTFCVLSFIYMKSQYKNVHAWRLQSWNQVKHIAFCCCCTLIMVQKCCFSTDVPLPILIFTNLWYIVDISKVSIIYQREILVGWCFLYSSTRR